MSATYQTTSTTNRPATATNRRIRIPARTGRRSTASRRDDLKIDRRTPSGRLLPY